MPYLNTETVGTDIRIIYWLFDMFCKSFFMFSYDCCDQIQKQKRYNLLFEIMADYEMIRKPLYDVHYIQSVYEWM